MDLQASRCAEVIVSYLKILSDFLIVLFILIMLSLINIYAFLFLAIIFLLFVFIYDYFLKNKIYTLGRDSANYQQIALKNINELFGSFKENIILNKKNYFSNYIMQGFKKDAEIDIKINTLRSVPKFVLEALIIVLSVLFVIILTTLGKNIEEFIIVISVFSVSIIRMVPLISTLTSAIGIIRFGLDGLEKTYKELNSLDYINTDEYRELDLKNFSFENLKLKNFSFKYNSKDKVIFNNANMKIYKMTDWDQQSIRYRETL